jgi:hypothetical protein
MDSAHDVLERYRRAFVAGDVEAVLGCFGFPIHVVGVTAGDASISTATGEDWRHIISNLLESYRRLGVNDAEALALEVSEPLPAVFMARVHWQLQRADGSQVYNFHAVYTLARMDGNLRIVAVAHDELPKLRASVG